MKRFSKFFCVVVLAVVFVFLSSVLQAKAQPHTSYSIADWKAWDNNCQTGKMTKRIKI
jgi:invasion protein IalB